MSLLYEELYSRSTPLGELMLRRRRMIRLGELDIYEVKLGEYFLMSSLFHEAEEQLAKLGLRAAGGETLDVVVGGLGLGYTAVAALGETRVRSLLVVDYLEDVIAWHKTGLVPLGSELTGDARCRLLHADFFALARDPQRGFDPDAPGARYDAILLDIDHTPTNLLDQQNARFYTEQGLRKLAQHLKPDGVFALWADGDAEDAFAEHLAKVFAKAQANTIRFANPVTGGESTGAVYVAKTPR